MRKQSPDIFDCTDDEIIQWVNSEAGQKAIKEAAQKIADFIREHKEKSKINPEILRRPMTI